MKQKKNTDKKGVQSFYTVKDHDRIGIWADHFETFKNGLQEHLVLCFMDRCEKLLEQGKTPRLPQRTSD